MSNDKFITLEQLTRTTKGLVNKVNAESTVFDSKIGDLANLTTTAKTDLVSAINEAATSGGSSGSETSNYTALTNKPSINNVTLTGNLTTSDLGITIPTVTDTYSSASTDAMSGVAVNSAITSAIGNINEFEVAVVQTLPSENIDTHTIYFVPKAGSVTDVHDEYMYINNNWELLGSTAVDLSGYLQSSDIADWAKAANKPTYTANEVGAIATSHAANAITSTDISNWNDMVPKNTGTVGGNIVKVIPSKDGLGAYLQLQAQGSGTASLELKAVDGSGSTITGSAQKISLTGIITPTSDTMAANKKYVDDAVSGITIPVTSVNTKTGDITLTAADVGALTQSSANNLYLSSAGGVSSMVSSSNSNTLRLGKAHSSDGFKGELQLSNTASSNQGYTTITPSATSNTTITLPATTGTLALTSDIPTVPTTVSSFTNDVGYLTSYTETDPVFAASAAAGISSTDISNWNAKSNFSGSYNDLTNKPTIPAATTVTQTLTSGTAIGSVNSTTLYAPTPYDDTALAARVTALESIPWVTYYSGTSEPQSSQGNNGDIYLQTGE